MADVSNGNKEPEAGFGLLDGNGVIKVLGRSPVNGDMPDITKIFSGVAAVSKLHKIGCRLFYLCRERTRQLKLFYGHPDLDQW